MISSLSTYCAVNISLVFCREKRKKNVKGPCCLFLISVEAGRRAVAGSQAYWDSQSRRSVLKPGDGLAQGHLLSEFKPTWFMVWPHWSVFLCLVQRMSLAAKCSRARANMINREQRLQAVWIGGGGAHYSLPSPLERGARLWGMKPKWGGEGCEEGRSSPPHQLSLGGRRE